MRRKPLSSNGRNNSPLACKIVKRPKESKRAEGSSKKEVVSPWGLSEVESKEKWAGGAQRKELVNGVSTKANKSQK